MIKKKIKSVYRMLRYAYARDINIKCTNVKYGDNKKQYYKVYKLFICSCKIFEKIYNMVLNPIRKLIK